MPSTQRKRSTTLAAGLVVAVVGVALSIVGWRVLASQERQMLIADFRLAAQDRVGRVRRELAESIEAMHSVRTFFASSRVVERGEFRTFVTPLLERRPEVDSLLWAPVVGRSQRAEFEQRVTRELAAPYRVRTSVHEAAPPDESTPWQTPVLYVEPWPERKSTLGLDLSSLAGLREDLVQAAQDGEPALSELSHRAEAFVASESRAGEFAWLLLAVYAREDASGGAPPAAQTPPLLRGEAGSVTGFLIAEIDVDRLRRFARIDDRWSGARVLIECDDAGVPPGEGSAPPPSTASGQRPAVRDRQDAPEVAGPSLVEDLDLPGAPWRVHVHASADDWRRNRSSWPLIGFLCGLALTLVFVIFTLRVERRADRVEQLVAKRTSELEQVGNNLKQELDRRRRVESDLELSKRRLQDLIDNCGAVIYVKDRQGRYLLVNERFESLFNVERGQAVGKRDADFFPTEMAEAFRRNDQHVAETGELLEIEEVAPHDEGPHTYLSLKFPLRDESGDIYAVAGVSTDITYRKRAEEQLLEYAERLERSNQDLKEFAFVVSHDLQEPLRAVKGFCSLLQDRHGHELSSEAREHVEYAIQGAERMKQLIDDLLDYSRVSSGPQRRQPVDISRVCERVLENLHERIEESGAEIHCDDLPTVVGDQTQLLQLFQNLISNAIKFRAPDRRPEIHVSCRFEDNAWTFAVRDNGIGIDQRDRDAVFSVFRRGHARDDYEGTGVGLAICRKVVQRHGGEIWVETEPGRGATFHFTLPVETDTLEADEEQVA